MAGLYQVQYIHNQLTLSGHKVEIGYWRLEDIRHVHDDLRKLDRQNPHHVKNFVVDLSSQADYRALLAQPRPQQRGPSVDVFI
nr:hypothetical protein BaRGS_004536 [Batillaria attramentaria]